MRIVQPPRGMPVTAWAVVSAEGFSVSGFPSLEAARAWASEWRASGATISPVCTVASATAALARAERALGGGPENSRARV